MDYHDYPYRAYHKEGHVEFHQKIVQTIKELREPSHQLKWQEYRMMNVVNLYYSHIDSHDVQMVAWVKANSKKQDPPNEEPT
jgi:hemerythrin